MACMSIILAVVLLVRLPSPAAVGTDTIWRPPCHAQGCVSKPKARELAFGEMRGNPGNASRDIERAKRYSPGTRVTVTVADSAPIRRYFVFLDSAELVVLNLDTPGLPKRQLLNMAIDNPDWMAATNRTTYKDNGLRVGPDGVFAKDRKLADLSQVVERIPRERIVSIR